MAPRLVSGDSHQVREIALGWSMLETHITKALYKMVRDTGFEPVTLPVKEGSTH